MEYRVAAVTGGACGIGEAAVRRFAEAGCAVVIADISERDGSALEQELAGRGSAALFVQTDVSSPDSVRNMVEAAAARFGGLDVLVNNAGIVEQDVLAEDESLEEWDRVLRVNLYGQFYCCRYALPFLRKRKGCIVNVASISGLTATRYCAAYCASKAGVIGLTRALAADYAQYGIRVNAVCPAACETPMMKNYFSAFPPEVVEEKVRRLSGPMGRMCQPREIAEGIYFLASPAAGYMSGAVVPIDGGYTAV